MKKQIINIIFFIEILTILPKIHSISVIYNLKIAEATKRQALEKKYQRSSIGALTLLDQFGTWHNGTKQNLGAGLGTLIYSPTAWYIRMDFAAGHVSQKNCKSHFSRTQTDDILFSSGYTIVLNKRSKLTFSALLGIPTHKDTIFEGIQLGTGHVGLGLQMDGAFIYSANKKHSLLAAARFVHFFPRNITITINQQMLPFHFSLGNLADLLIAHYSSWGGHKFEIGYDATFGFGANICPQLDIINEVVLMRNSFYTNYRYGFLAHQFPSALIAGFAYSFDHKPKIIGLKNLFTLWLTGGISF